MYKKPVKANDPVCINISLKRSHSGKCGNHSPDGIAANDTMMLFNLILDAIGQSRKWEPALSFP